MPCDSAWSDLFDCPRAHAFVPDIARLISLVAEALVLLRTWPVAQRCMCRRTTAHSSGRPRFDELRREDLETLVSNERLVGIDVSGGYGAHELAGKRGHGYWVANQRVSSDVLLSMIDPFDPAWRGLVHAPVRSMWTSPDDYPRRVGDAVYEAAPELRRLSD